MQKIPVRFRLIALAVLLAFGVQPVVLAVEGGRQYTVKSGDTIGAISASYGVPSQRLVELNNLPDPDQILAGQNLLLPDDATNAPASSAPSPASTPAGRDYLVKRGDSLSSIAASYGVSLATLIAANSLTDPDHLTVGRKLTIPAAGPSASAPTLGGSPSPAGGSAGSSAGNSDVGSMLEAAAGSYGLDPPLVKALAWYLSGWKSDATSPGGAVGIMQVTASTQDFVSSSILKRNADRMVARDNAEIGVAYLAYLVKRQGDERLGVGAYLQGPASIARAGLDPRTGRALDAIYGLRTRFSTSGTPTTRSAFSSATATPTSAPTAGGDLSAAISAAAKRIAPGAHLGVAARNVTTGQQLNLRAGEIFPSASVNKLAIMVELFRQIGAGKLARTSSISSDLERMITVSDNDAANRLLDAVGEANVNATMASLGLGSTIMRNHFSGVASDGQGFNQTTPSDAATLMSLLLGDRVVSASASQEMRALLARNQDNSKLVRGLPPGTRVFHKSGWFPTVANDVGVVYGPRATYVLAIFTDGDPDADTGNSLVAEVSRLIYDAWAR